jgi:hypothetical protein
VAEADKIASQIDSEDVKAAAQTAKEAADTAKQAAVVANHVADHSVKVTTHAKAALKHALHALHDARVDSENLNKDQKASLQKAEGKLREATKSADYGKLKKVEEKDAKKEKMQEQLEKKRKGTELEQMREDVKELRRKLKEKGGDAESDKELAELQNDLDKLEADMKSGGKSDAAVNDEVKAEIERLRNDIDKYEAKSPDKKEQDRELMTDVKMKPLQGGEGNAARAQDMKHESPTPVEDKGIDIDTQMPYGDLEPFGREDTAQELTESSVRESDAMVDQLERAEVAEEKRAVFRALTRLRGAAITSFDGVARSQTGNIDEYNKVHKWRRTHPLHHLADEESDVSKWAFPDNADLIQVAHPPKSGSSK